MSAVCGLFICFHTDVQFTSELFSEPVLFIVSIEPILLSS